MWNLQATDPGPQAADSHVLRASFEPDYDAVFTTLLECGGPIRDGLRCISRHPTVKNCALVIRHAVHGIEQPSNSADHRRPDVLLRQL